MQREQVRKILAENICVDYEDCVDSSNLRYDLGADSLSMLSFGVEIADEMGIKDSELDSKIYELETVGELIDYVTRTSDSRS